MNTKDWFDFSHRVTRDEVLVKTVDGRQDVKMVRGSFNWLAVLFNWIYVLVTTKYKTPGFAKKFLVIFCAGSAVITLLMLLLGIGIGFIMELAMYAWIGLMFDTWFKNQLLANGYHVQTATEATTQRAKLN